MKDFRNRLLAKAAQKGIPISGTFELLPVCNFQCKMCYVRKSMEEVKNEGGLLSGKEWLKLIDQAKEEGMLFPLLTGGEPLLHPDFQEIMCGMDSMGVRMSINSNGSLIDEQMAHFLNEHRPEQINITLYGASEKSYELLCGNGEAFGKVREAVKLLKKYGISVKLNTSITPLNVHELEAMLDYARKEKCILQAATYMFPPYRRDSHMAGKNFRMSPEKAGEMKAYVDRLTLNEMAFLEQAKAYENFVPLDQLAYTWTTDEAYPMRCRGGLSSFWIDWQGNMGNCGLYSSINISTKGRSFAEVWKEVQSKSKETRYYPACAQCPNRELCHVCLAMVNNECGSHTGRPEYVCRMNQAAAKRYRELL